MSQHKTVKGIVRLFTRTHDNKNPSLSEEESFLFLAKNYKLTGAPIYQLCQHNANVAFQARNNDVARIWFFLMHI